MKDSEVLKYNRIINIQDPDATYNLFKKHHKRTMITDKYGNLVTKNIKQPKVD